MTKASVPQVRGKTRLTCKTCGKSFELYNACVRKGRGGYCSKPCWYAAKRAAPRKRTEKRCPTCKTVKPLADFTKNRRHPDGHAEACKSCRSASKKAHYAANREGVRAKVNAWRAANETIVSEWNRRTYTKHRTSRLARVSAKRRANPEFWRDYQRKAYAKNPAAFKASKERRKGRDPDGFRAVQAAGARRYEIRKRGVPTQHFTAAQIAERVSVFGNRCAYCGGPFEHLDHLKPIALGGPHFLSNLRPSCRTCNQRKRAMPAKQWLARCTATE